VTLGKVRRRLSVLLPTSELRVSHSSLLVAASYETVRYDFISINTSQGSLR